MRWVLVLALALPGLAEAAPKEKAKVAYQVGVQAFKKGDYEAALKHFEVALAFDASPVIIYNMARAHEELGSGGRAVHFYQLYLTRFPDADDRPEVERRMRVMQAIVDRERGGSTAPAERSYPLRPWAWTCLGVGVAAMGVGAIFGASISGHQEDFDEALSAADKRAAESDAEDAAFAANLAVGIGGGLVLAGVALWVFDPGESVSASAGGLTWRF